MQNYQDDAIKPSRANRIPKKKWRKNNAFRLTSYYLTPMINKVAHNGGTILAYRIVAAQTAIKRFFCVQNFSVLHYVGLGGTVARLAGATPVRQFHSVRHQMIGVVWCRVYNLIRVAIMNTNPLRANTAQNPTKNPIFSGFEGGAL